MPVTTPDISLVGKWLHIEDDILHPPMLIRLAQGYGMETSPEIERLIERAERMEQSLDEEREIIRLADEAEEYLNSVAPEGYSFGWYRDEFMFWPDAWWEIDERDQ